MAPNPLKTNSLPAPSKKVGNLREELLGRISTNELQILYTVISPRTTLRGPLYLKGPTT